MKTLDALMHLWKEWLDSINTDGGHIFLSTIFIIGSLWAMHYLQMVEAKDLFLIAIGWIGKAMVSGKANGIVKPPTPPTV